MQAGHGQLAGSDLLTCADILNRDSRPLCSKLQLMISVLPALLSDIRQNQTIHMDAMQHSFLQQLLNAITVILIGVRYEYCFQAICSLILQKRNQPVFSHTVDGRAPAVNQESASIPAVDINTVSLPHIQKGKFKTSCRA